MNLTLCLNIHGFHSDKGEGSDGGSENVDGDYPVNIMYLIRL